jgi:hypothetical protein
LKQWSKRVLAGHKDKLVYLDETGFDLAASRTHGRAERGRKVYGARSGNRRPRTSLIGALVRGKLTAPMLFSGTTNTALFNQWLKDMLAACLGKRHDHYHGQRHLPQIRNDARAHQTGRVLPALPASVLTRTQPYRANMGKP